ncbi:hypothetical protein J6590_004155 [Homalodisca vitripennis]|nr:hypothetical protein J6590_004155 [Homalodisca vitripennis]
MNQHESSPCKVRFMRERELRKHNRGDSRRSFLARFCSIPDQMERFTAACRRDDRKQPQPLIDRSRWRPSPGDRRCIGKGDCWTIHTGYQSSQSTAEPRGRTDLSRNMDVGGYDWRGVHGYVDTPVTLEVKISDNKTPNSVFRALSYLNRRLLAFWTCGVANSGVTDASVWRQKRAYTGTGLGIFIVCCRFSRLNSA